MKKPLTSGKRRKPAPVVDYPPGYFSEPMRKGFPPNFVSAYVAERAPQGRPAHEQREQAMAAGVSFATGTVLMPKTPRNKAPGWMKEKA